jgi:AcrR family transcriptional regulator
MVKRSQFELGPDEIIETAIDILREQGLDAVSMRSVASRLGVSPVPLYSRVGNKEALLDAMADHLLADLAPPSSHDEAWTDYAARWARELRSRLRLTRDSRLILGPPRHAYVEASRPLVDAMRGEGLAADAAVQGCRLLMWATVGFVAMEAGAAPPPRGTGRTRRPGSDPEGLRAEEADELFELHIRYLIEGITRDAAVEAGRQSAEEPSRRRDRPAPPAGPAGPVGPAGPAGPAARAGPAGPAAPARARSGTNESPSIHKRGASS